MILFFVRRFNDIDHTVPVVYRMAKDGYKDVAVLASNPRYDIKNDFRLNFLKNQYAVEVDHVYRYFMPTLIHKLTSWLICRPLNERTFGKYYYSNREKPKRNSVMPFRRFVDTVCKALSSLFTPERLFVIFDQCISKLGAAGRERKGFINRIIFERLFGIGWSIEMLRKKGVSLLVFDLSIPGRWNTSSLVKAGKKLNIPVISIPHGMNLVDSKVFTRRMYGGLWNGYDAIILQHEKHRMRAAESGIAVKKLFVFGSTRYCSEWENIYFNIVPKSNYYAARNIYGKLKVVLMDHSSRYMASADDVLDTIERIGNMDCVDLVVKPSTGNAKRTMTSRGLYNIAKIDNKTHSVELIRWADVVIGTISSISLDVLIMNKVFIYPKYFLDVDMMWETMEACWVVNNYTELEDALYRIRRTPGYKQYKEENVNKLVTETVYGGEEGRDVLGDYENFIISLAEEKKALKVEDTLPVSPLCE